MLSIVLPVNASTGSELHQVWSKVMTDPIEDRKMLVPVIQPISLQPISLHYTSYKNHCAVCSTLLYLTFYVAKGGDTPTTGAYIKKLLIPASVLVRPFSVLLASDTHTYILTY